MDTKYYGDMITGYTATFHGKETGHKYEIHKVRAACPLAGSTPCKVFEHTAWGFTNQEESEKHAADWLKTNHNVNPRT